MDNTSKLNLLDLINENNDYPELDDIRIEEVEFSAPEVVSVVGTDGKTRTTKVVVSSRIPGDDSKPIPVYYWRRPLPDYLPSDTVLEKDGVTSAQDVLWQLADNYNIVIPPEDLESTVPNGDLLTLRIKPTALEWLGEVTVGLADSISLADVITVTELTGLRYPDHDDPAIGQAQTYSYDLDCTFFSYFLEVLAPGSAFDDTSLAASLNTVGNDIWVASDEACPFNLRGSTVTFEGSPKGLLWGNENYQNVVVVRLGPLCTNLQGQLNLHYNPVEEVPDAR